ncbi:hypothetical protein LCGC14_1976570 [marine sediment metagenome]|uniref:Uncharacterized protein n=1 Tax=marine sediment metagenome TaxID=412755 RepID=A0A0F9HNL9_9ZZZZ
MELNFKSLEEYIQAYMDQAMEEQHTTDINAEGDTATYTFKSLSADLDKVSPSQRLGFIEKYMEFVSPKQLRRGTSTASDDKDFNLVEAK